MSRLQAKISTSLDKLTEAFPYQREALEVVRSLDYSAIFLEQGLGKTKIAIDLTLDWLRDGVIDTVIVITKKGLVRNWLREFEIHSHVKPRVISSDRSANHRAIFSPCRVFVSNYEAIALEEQKIRAISNHRSIAVILDESQKIKNPESNLAKAFFRLSDCFKKRVIMTGTPMANRPYDIWAQVYFLDAGKSLGSDFGVFKANLDLPAKGTEEVFFEAIGDVFPRISEFAIRQTKKGSGLELPGKVYRSIQSEWEPRQKALYESIRNDLRVEVLRDGKSVLDDSEALLKRLLRLLQVASNPKLVDEAYNEKPGKLTQAEQLVEEIIGKGEKLIIWTSFVANCRYLKKHFDPFGVVQIHGNMTTQDRDRSVQKFMKQTDIRVLVATPAAAKEGLTLTAANHVVFYDRSFSLDDYLQAQDRIHRISQSKTCFVYNIEMPDSIDEWVDLLIASKSAAVSVGMGDAGREELESVLELNLEDVLRQVLGE